MQKTKIQILPFSITLFLAILLGNGSIFADSLELVGSCTTIQSAREVYVIDTIAYVADRGRVTVVNVADPANPYVMGSTGEARANNIIVKDTVAYLNSDHTWFETVSVADPFNPFRLGWFYIGPGGSYSKGLVLQDTIVYLAIGWFGIASISISDPASPYLIGKFDTPGYAYDLSMKDSLVYVADAWSLEIYNYVDLLNPQHVGSCSLSHSQRGIFVRDSFAFLVGGGGFIYGYLHIVDISNPLNPIKVASVYPIMGGPYDVWLNGDYAYVVALDTEDPLSQKEYYEGGLSVVDISDPLAPMVIAYCETPGIANGVFVQDTLIYVADWSSLRIYRHIGAGIEEKENSKLKPGSFELRIKPNPFTKATRLEVRGSSKAQNSSLTIYDASGRLVKSVKLATNHYQLGADLLPGLYFLKLSIGEHKEIQKLIKIR